MLNVTFFLTETETVRLQRILLAFFYEATKCQAQLPCHPSRIAVDGKILD